MHEQAQLQSPFLAADKTVGDPISISEVEKHFKTSWEANNALAFACAKCGVPVSARIIVPFKEGRKVTPSSSFRARDKARPHTCDREPPSSAPQEQGNGDGPLPAHPVRGDAPTVWIDPRTTPKKSGAEGAATGLTTTSHVDDPSGARSRSGTGRSVGQSKTIERFARWWDGKTVAQRKAEPLWAGWNPGQTYFSGFHVLGYQPDVSGVGMKIFVGTADTVIEYRSGFAIDLKLPQATAQTIQGLRIWVSRTCLALCAEGTALERQLQDYASTPVWTHQVDVYCLGSFEERKGAGTPMLSLELGHPHMMWIP